MLCFFVFGGTAYWKDPQATPLIPSMTSGTINGSHLHSNQLAMIVQNPWILSILIAALVMLVLLLVGLLFMTRAKRVRSAEVKRYEEYGKVLSATTIVLLNN